MALLFSHSLCGERAQFVSIEKSRLQMLWFCGEKSTLSTELWWQDGHTYRESNKKDKDGYYEWRPAENHLRIRREQRPRWSGAPPVFESRQTSAKMPCVVSRLAFVRVCVSLRPYCQLMHLSTHHFCLSVWHRDNAEPPREAACISYCGLLVLGLLWERWIEGSLILWVRGLGLQTCSSPVWDFAAMPDT